MKPRIGQIVTIYGYLSNGSEEHPAIINRVWPRQPQSEHVPINLTAFPDSLPPVTMNAVYLFPTKDRAIAYRADTPGAHVVAFLSELTRGAARF